MAAGRRSAAAGTAVAAAEAVDRRRVTLVGEPVAGEATVGGVSAGDVNAGDLGAGEPLAAPLWEVPSWLSIDSVGSETSAAIDVL
jgi:hypothetical protein